MKKSLKSSLCVNKKPYNTSSKAFSVGLFEAKRDNKNIYTYCCPFCYSWHLTSSNQNSGDLTKYKVN